MDFDLNAHIQAQEKKEFWEHLKACAEMAGYYCLIALAFGVCTSWLW